MKDSEDVKYIYRQEGSPFGVIIPDKDGQLWEHQTAGTRCLSSRVRGKYIQFKTITGPKIFPTYCDLKNYRKCLNNFLDSLSERYSKVISPVDYKTSAEEAWIPVKIDIQYDKDNVPDEFQELVPYDGQKAIMVYANSD
jgi:hypothetical protein